LLAYILTGGRYVSAPDNPISQVIPDVHMGIAFDPDSNPIGLVKTHYRRNHPIPQNFKCCKAIYLYRNPADIIVSSYKYLIQHAVLPQDNSGHLSRSAKFQTYAHEFVADRGFKGWQADFGSWNDHVASWVFSNNQYDMLVVSYELLQANTQEVLDHMCRFLEIKFSKSLLTESIAANQLSATKAREPTNRGLGEGRSHYGIDFLPPRLQSEFQHHFGETISRLDEVLADTYGTIHSRQRSTNRQQ
jgi:hypothetical protein